VSGSPVKSRLPIPKGGENTALRGRKYCLKGEKILP